MRIQALINCPLPKTREFLSILGLLNFSVAGSLTSPSLQSRSMRQLKGCLGEPLYNPLLAVQSLFASSQEPPLSANSPPARLHQTILSLCPLQPRTGPRTSMSVGWRHLGSHGLSVKTAGHGDPGMASLCTGRGCYCRRSYQKQINSLGMPFNSLFSTHLLRLAITSGFSLLPLFRGTGPTCLSPRPSAHSPQPHNPAAYYPSSTTDPSPIDAA